VIGVSVSSETVRSCFLLSSRLEWNETVNYYLRRRMLASRKGRKVFNVQLKRSAIRYTCVLSIESKGAMGPLDIKSMLERRRMVTGEPNFVEGRYARVRPNIPIFIPIRRIRLDHGVSPGTVDERQQRDDRLGSHGILSSLPFYFPYSRLSSAVLREKHMR
jgi:hypothetical protein